MRLLTYWSDENTLRPAVAVGDIAIDLIAAITGHAEAGNDTGEPSPQSVEELLHEGAAGLDRARAAAEWASTERPDLADPLTTIRFAAPVTRPQKIIGVGLNYRDHCEEINRPIPTGIQTFGMFANTLIGHKEAIELARMSEKMDWEAELVIVVGKAGKHIPHAQALDHVAGFTIGNDVSARDFQLADPQAMRGKSGDTHSPIGPWIVMRDELPDDSSLDIALTINGEVKQSSNTGQRVFQTADIVSFLSGFFTLQPGDLIFTGTPGGVGMGRDPQQWLNPGDEISVTVEGIGTLINPCVMEQ